MSALTACKLGYPDTHGIKVCENCSCKLGKGRALKAESIVQRVHGLSHSDSLQSLRLQTPGTDGETRILNSCLDARLGRLHCEGEGAFWCLHFHLLQTVKDVLQRALQIETAARFPESGASQERRTDRSQHVSTPKLRVQMPCAVFRNESGLRGDTCLCQIRTCWRRQGRNRR